MVVVVFFFSGSGDQKDEDGKDDIIKELYVGPIRKIFHSVQCG